MVVNILSYIFASIIIVILSIYVVNQIRIYNKQKNIINDIKNNLFN